MAADFFQELKSLLDALEEGAVEYALCGGVALAIQRFTKLIHGQPFMLDALLVDGPLVGAWERRQTAEIEGGRVWVIARDDLIALKLAAGRPQDLVDVQRLREAGRG